MKGKAPNHPRPSIFFFEVHEINQTNFPEEHTLFLKISDQVLVAYLKIAALPSSTITQQSVFLIRALWTELLFTVKGCPVHCRTLKDPQRLPTICGIKIGYILCEAQCKMKMQDSLFKTHEEFLDGNSRESNQLWVLVSMAQDPM